MALMGGQDSLLRPGPRFDALPSAERRRLASTFLDMFQRLRTAHRSEPAFHAPVQELIAWAAAGEDIEHGVQVWRRELHRAQLAGAGRSPADKGQGWPACSAGGSGGEPVRSVKTPYTPTAVPSGKESAN